MLYVVPSVVDNFYQPSYIPTVCVTSSRNWSGLTIANSYIIYFLYTVNDKAMRQKTSAVVTDFCQWFPYWLCIVIVRCVIMWSAPPVGYQIRSNFQLTILTIISKTVGHFQKKVQNNWVTMTASYIPASFWKESLTADLIKKFPFENYYKCS